MALTGTIGALGFGNMGAAIFRGVIASGAAAPGQLRIYDVDDSRRAVAREIGIQSVESPEALAHACDVLLLATKPQDMGAALDALRPGIDNHTFVISIAAGIGIRFIQENLGADTRVARVMPNTPALVGACASGVALSNSCTEADRETVNAIFSSIGVVEYVSEDLIDGVTALSGSGPAYFFFMVECMTKAAMAEGLSESQAATLAGQTLLGAGKLLMESGETASVLRERVTSKGGTTFAALESFRSDGFETVIANAVRAAAERSRELGA